jgi:hypothetical protein
MTIYQLRILFSSLSLFYINYNTLSDLLNNEKIFFWIKNRIDSQDKIFSLLKKLSLYHAEEE